jgi:hypothetical protein
LWKTVLFWLGIGLMVAGFAVGLWSITWVLDCPDTGQCDRLFLMSRHLPETIFVFGSIFIGYILVSISGD